MEIKEIEHLAELSKLEFSYEELKNFSTDFMKLVELADVIRNVDIQGERKLNFLNMSELRDDIPKQSFTSENLLKNAPDKKKDFFAVPRVVE